MGPLRHRLVVDFEQQHLVYNQILTPSVDLMTENNELKKQFSRNIEEMTGPLYRLASRLTFNSADAEDLVSEAVTKAWISYGSLENKERFRPWIFRILHNCFVDNYRKKSVCSCKKLPNSPEFLFLADAVHFPFKFYAPFGMDACGRRCNELRQAINQTV